MLRVPEPAGHQHHPVESLVPVRRDASSRQDVVFLDQDGIIQTQAMIAAATALDGEFLGQAQAGKGLSRIDDLGARSRNEIRILAGLGCNASKKLQEVQCGSLTGEQRPCWAFKFA